MSPDVAASVKARLLARAKAQREEFERTLVRYAGERLLYRLGVSPARERCILKGASLLTVSQFEVIGERITRFLGPVWSSLVEGGSFASTWEPGGPWR